MGVLLIKNNGTYKWRYQNNSSKGHKALNKTHDMSLQSGPYKLGYSDAYETQKVSPWPVPELTGVQWVEPLPQAGYITLPLEGTSMSH